MTLSNQKNNNLKTKIISTVALLFATLFSAIATDTEPKKDSTQAHFSLANFKLEDDAYVAHLDNMIKQAFFPEVSISEKITPTKDNDSLFKVPSFEEEVYKERLAKLNSATPFDLDFTPQVRRYIDVYAVRRREQVSKMLGLAEYYFPMFEEMLDKYDMPLELKYLAIVESALNPAARSRVGATGLWQFMYGTAKMNGLAITSYVDDRNDPLKSTEAACKYLQTLYGIFDDWNLALAAYNSGPGNVNKAIRRSGGKRSYWEIRPYLPRETAGYVPAFIAVNYIMNYSDEHQIYPTEVKQSYFSTDTISVEEQLSFDQITKLLDVSEEELSFLNPAYRYKVIPKRSKKPYKLVLPSNKIGLFAEHEDSIYTLAKKDFEIRKPAIPKEVAMNNKVYHKVRSGEVLGTIAEKYGVSVSSIKRWNGMRGTTIRVGQRLAIYPRKAPASSKTASKKSTTTNSDAKGKHFVHKVRKGETFYSIAKAYPGISAQNIMGWNNMKNARGLKVGMSLKIYQQ